MVYPNIYNLLYLLPSQAGELPAIPHQRSPQLQGFGCLMMEMNDISSAVTQLEASRAGRPLWASWETPAPTNWPHRESRKESSRSHLSQRMRVRTSESMTEAARKYWLRGSTINPLQISCKISSVLVELEAFILIHLWLIGSWCSLLKHCNDQRSWCSLTAGYIWVLRNERNSVSFCYLALW